MPKTLQTLGEVNQLPVAYIPDPVQPAPTNCDQSVPNYEYLPADHAQSPFVPLAYAPLPNPPQYTVDPEIEDLLQFTFNNYYQEYEPTLGQRPPPVNSVPAEAPYIC